MNNAKPLLLYKYNYYISLCRLLLSITLLLIIIARGTNKGKLIVKVSKEPSV